MPSNIISLSEPKPFQAIGFAPVHIPHTCVSSKPVPPVCVGRVRTAGSGLVCYTVSALRLYGFQRKGRMRVLIVDDHPLLRQAIREVVESHFPSAAVHEASTGEESLRILRAQHIDLVILDIVLPDYSGLTVLKQMKQFSSATKCLVLSMHDEPHYARLAMTHGASGYLTKESTAGELCEAMRTILAGRQAVMEPFLEPLGHRQNRRDQRWPHESLSVRELEVLSMLARGRTVSQVAKRLALSVKTISTYRSRLLEKLRLRTTADLIRYAVDKKLVK